MSNLKKKDPTCHEAWLKEKREKQQKGSLRHILFIKKIFFKILIAFFIGIIVNPHAGVRNIKISDSAQFPLMITFCKKSNITRRY